MPLNVFSQFSFFLFFDNSFSYLFLQQKKGDVLYAQLDMPESEDSGNNIKVRKPAPYAPTVYADVTPTEVINKAETNSKLPTYENVQKTTVGV